MAAWKFATGALVLAAGTGVAGVLVAGSRNDNGGEAGATDDSVAAQNTAEVTRRDLEQVEELDGTIDYGGANALILGGEGTLTAVPKVGTVIGNGDRVVEVDGLPVIAVEGAFPFWRPLNNDMDDGKDVLQLEYLLATMGYAEEHDMTVDDEFTWETQEAVEAFQKEHGLDDDGELALGEVIVITDPVRVESVGGRPGQPASAAQITVTRPQRTVQIKVPVESAHLVEKGYIVDVELPDGRVIDGRVTRLGAAETSSDGTTTVPVSLAVEGAGDLADGTPVDVRIVVEETKRALAVPVEAVLALAEGGYAVEVPGRGGSASRLVAVELGMFADGWVEIDGDIEPGTSVVIP